MTQRTAWTVLLALALAAPAAAAQDAGSKGTTSGTQSVPASRGTDTAGRPRPAPEIEAITVTGCIRRDQGVATTGSTAAATPGGDRRAGSSGQASSERFLLVDAAASSANATSTGIQPGGALTYVVDGPGIADHVGERVQVTGKLVPPAGGTARASGSAVSAPASGAAAEGQLRVSSVRTISRSCPTK
jgi:hypothetical protein